MSIHESLVARRAELQQSIDNTKRLQREVDDLSARCWLQPQPPQWYLDHPTGLVHIMASQHGGPAPAAIVKSVMEFVSPGPRFAVQIEYGAICLSTTSASVNTDGIERLAAALVAGGGRFHKITIDRHWPVIFYGPGQWAVQGVTHGRRQPLVDALQEGIQSS